jgi:hypothetical protein
MCSVFGAEQLSFDQPTLHIGFKSGEEPGIIL